MPLDAMVISCQSSCPPTPALVYVLKTNRLLEILVCKKTGSSICKGHTTTHTQKKDKKGNIVGSLIFILKRIIDGIKE